MSWKYHVGNLINKIDISLIKSKSKFIKKSYPYGRNWIFDLKRILNYEPKIIVDAGANVGSVSKDLSFFFPNTVIYAFEPINNTFQLLCEKVKNNPNIFPIKSALGPSNETSIIQLNNEDTINSLKVKIDPSQKTEEINVIRLDDFLLKKTINKVDILKIDVEGFEFEVLEGCGDLDIDIILLEVGYQFEPTKVYFSEVDQFMRSKNYQLVNIYDLMRDLVDRKSISYSNNLYIKKDLLKTF